MFQRSSGVLLHVSSLPGPYGIGDLGPEAWRLVDWLAEAGCSYWQILPLGPTGFADSPYASHSSYAGNVDLISPDLLIEERLIDQPPRLGPGDHVDFPLVSESKWRLVEQSHSRLAGELRSEFDEFIEREGDWLEAYALFMALKDAHHGASWVEWDPALRRRDPVALSAAAAKLGEGVSLHQFGQFIFYRQLEQLRRHAQDRGVRIIGDVPLYVATDSVDVWLRPDLFAIDIEAGQPRLVAGVPPDRFSPVGQHWGVPTYRWEAHVSEGFEWWVGRIEAFLRQADLLRIDHFTGFARYYAIEGTSTDPRDGEWHDGPGAALFDSLTNRLGDIDLILEDLGPLGDVVEGLRRKLGYPGMRIVQEAFDDDAEDEHHPENFPVDCVVYTGTHDNDTARGRFEAEGDGYRQRALRFTGGTVSTFSWDLITCTWNSTPIVAIAPMQDILDLGSDARMNRPGTIDGNWQWRMPGGLTDSRLASKLAELNRQAGRDPMAR